jgi:hypothetical protein
MNFQKILQRRIAPAITCFFFGWLALGFFSGPHSMNRVKKKLLFDQTAYSDSNRFVMCNLITGPEVAGYSPFESKYHKSESDPNLSQSCFYYFTGDNNKSGTIVITLDDKPTAKFAIASVKSFEQVVKENWGGEAEMVDSLGQRAATWGDDEVSLWIAIGNRVLEIDLKGEFPDVTSTQKKNAAKALARFVMKKLKLK